MPPAEYEVKQHHLEPPSTQESHAQRSHMHTHRDTCAHGHWRSMLMHMYTGYACTCRAGPAGPAALPCPAAEGIHPPAHLSQKMTPKQCLPIPMDAFSISQAALARGPPRSSVICGAGVRQRRASWITACLKAGLPSIQTSDAAAAGS